MITEVKKLRNLAILTITVIIVSFLASLYVFNNSVSPNIVENIKLDRVVYTSDELVIKDYIDSKNNYISLGSDAFFLIEKKMDHIYKIAITFEETVEEPLSISVYFSEKGKVFSEKTVVETKIFEGRKEVELLIDSKVDALRIDIGNKKDQVVPKFILDITKFNLFNLFIDFFAVIFFIAIAAIIAYLYRKQIIKSIYNLRTNNNKIFICIIFLFLTMVLFKLNMSHMREYKAVIPNNINEINAITIGNSKSIRSDEWLVMISETFNNFYKPNLGVGNFSEWIVRYSNPVNWGYLVLPYEYGYSYASLFPYFLLLISSIYFFKIFEPNNMRICLLLGLIVSFSPGIIWWNNSILFFGYWFAIIVLFYRFFKIKDNKNKILCSIGLVLAVSSFILWIYPACQIPLVYLGILVIIGIFWQEGKIDFQKKDIIYITIVVASVGFILISYFINNMDFIESVSKTVYPGRRFSNGGNLPSSYWWHYLLMPFIVDKDISFLNNSEVSSFITLFPLSFLIYFLRRNDFKKYKIVNLLIVYSIISITYMLLGFIPLISKISLFSYTISERVFIIFGLAQTILLILELKYLSNLKLSYYEIKKLKIKCVYLTLVIIGFLTFSIITQPEIVDFIGLGKYLMLSLIIILMSNLLILGKNVEFLAIFLILTIWSGFSINPINLGTVIMDSTPIAKTIKEIDAVDTGRWITTNDMILSKYVYAQGVDCINSLSYPPRFDLFYPVDKEQKFVEVYNRYAHVNVNIEYNDTTNFKLIQQDYFIVNLNVNDIKAWDVKYIISKEALKIDTNSLFAEKIYTDSLDGYEIYKVKYK